jgi:peptidoglycan/LPS O-acetylase OafA/YrhL
VVSGEQLILCFLCGIVFYTYRDVIRLNGRVFALACAVLVALFWSGTGEYLMTLPIAYITIYLGLCNPHKPRFFFSGDYSYGMYLYGFPLQQAAVAVWPAQTWWLNILLVLPVAFAVAHLSWWYVEKPALRLRTHLMRFEAEALPAVPRLLRRLLEASAPAKAGSSP